MTRDEALKLLGLAPEADGHGLETAYRARADELDRRIADAPMEALKEKYRAERAQLDRAREALTAVPGVAGLRASQVRDLPGARPMFTQSGTPTPSAPMVVAEGQILAQRYEIRRQLGAGGMGAVFAAFDRTRGEEIAIKVLLPGLVSNEGARDRFLTEGKLSSSLSHPNIVRVFDVQQDGPLHFLTMELLEGRTLRAEMEAKKRFEIAEVVGLGQALCEALAYAHHHTIHRDVKPENVWLGKDGAIKLMDFGIARLMSASQLTVTGMSMGTAYYMAPEQLKGAKEVDGRADQYSVAVVLYEMLTGDVPAGRVRAAREKRSDVPVGLSAALDHALESSPVDRFPDMKAFAQALATRGVSTKTIRWVSVIAAVIAVTATSPFWWKPLVAHMRTQLRDETATQKAEKAREDARRESDAWTKWQRMARMTSEPQEIRRAREAVQRGEALLADHQAADAQKAFEEARQLFVDGVEKGKELLTGLTVLKKARDEATAAAKDWENMSAGFKVAETPEVPKARDAAKAAEEFAAAGKEKEAVASFEESRDMFRAACSERAKGLTHEVLRMQDSVGKFSRQLVEMRTALIARVQHEDRELKACKDDLAKLERESEDLDRSLANERDNLASAESRNQDRIRQQIGKLEKNQSDNRKDRTRRQKDLAVLEPRAELLHTFQAFCDVEIHKSDELDALEKKARIAAERMQARDVSEACVLYADVDRGLKRLLLKHGIDAWMTYEPARRILDVALNEWKQLEPSDWKGKLPQRDAAQQTSADAMKLAEDGRYAEAQTACSEATKVYRALTRDWQAFGPTRKAARDALDAMDRTLGASVRERLPDIESTFATAEVQEAQGRLADARRGYEKASGQLADLKAEAAAARSPDSTGRTPLHRAAERGDVAAIARQLIVGAEIGRADSSGHTPLHAACRSGSIDACRALIEKGASVNARAGQGPRPLHVATAGERLEIVDLLLAKNAEIDGRGGADELTPLHHAIVSGKDAAAKHLVEKGSDVEAVTQSGLGALHLAAQHARPAIVALLLEKKAAPEGKSPKTLTPLVCAARCGCLEAMESLVKAGADVNWSTAAGTALDAAAGAGKFDAVTWLLERSAGPRAADGQGRTPLHLAAEAGFDKIAVRLVERGADVDAKDKSGRTPLHLAVEAVAKGHTADTVRALLGANASVNASDASGTNALHLACRSGLVAVVKLLVERSADVRSGNPLYLAAAGGHGAIVRLLLDRDAPPDAAVGEAWTPLHAGAAGGFADVVRALVGKRAAIDAKTSKSETPLLLAVSRGHTDVARVLVEAKADVDAADASGRSAAGAAAKDPEKWGWLMRASRSHANVIRLYRGVSVAELTGHDRWVYGVAFQPDGNAVVSGSMETESSLKLWDFRTQTESGSRQLSERPRAVAFSPDGKTVAVATSEGVRLWRPGQKSYDNVMSGHDTLWVAYDPSGKMLAFDDADGSLHVVDGAGRAVKKIARGGGAMTAGAFSADGKRLAVGLREGEIAVYDTATWSQLRSASAHGSAVRSLSFSRDGRYLLSGSATEELALWEADSGDRVFAWAGKGGHALFSQDGTAFAAGTRNGRITIWETGTKSVLKEFNAWDGLAKRGAVYCLSFSADGKFLASGHDDGIVRIWGSE